MPGIGKGKDLRPKPLKPKTLEIKQIKGGKNSTISAEDARSIQGQGKEMEEPHEIVGMSGLGKDSPHPISKFFFLKKKNF